MQIKNWLLSLGLLFVAITDSAKGNCSLNSAQLHLSGSSGFIVSPNASDQHENCTWSFSDDTRMSGAAIVLHIKDMKLKKYKEDSYWWYAAGLYLNGQNIADFQPNVCFIFVPDSMTCDNVQNATEGCEKMISFTGRKMYPPKLNFLALEDYFTTDYTNSFRIEYTYSSCSTQDIPSTPTTTTDFTEESSATLDMVKHETGIATHALPSMGHIWTAPDTKTTTLWSSNFEIETTTGGDNEEIGCPTQDEIVSSDRSAIVIGLSIACAVFALMAIFLFLRLYQQRNNRHMHVAGKKTAEGSIANPLYTSV